MPRDRDESGRPLNARPRDALGRPLPRDAVGILPEPAEQALPSDQTLLRAQELLDRDLPFQAHEVLETRWKSCPASEREYWQGLAQAAVALTHLRRGNTVGARRLAERAVSHLAGRIAPPPGAPVEVVIEQLHALATGTTTELVVVVRP